MKIVDKSLSKEDMACINNESLQSFRNWFYGYIERFRSSQKDVRENILLKKMHTKRVCEEILHIGRKLGLKENALRFSELTALFHDIGRFEQYARYKTFADYKSENHAELGVKILKKHGVLNCLDDSLRDLFYRIVSYHNRACLPDRETGRCLFYTKLLRDADKLDIWKVLTDYYHRRDGVSNNAIELELPDTPEISDKVYEAVINKRIVDTHHVRNLNDFKILQVRWIFDVNFKPTLEAVIYRNYIELICSVLPASEKVNKIKGAVNCYVEEQLLRKKYGIRLDTKCNRHFIEDFKN
jgi:putative nucleotidyltransferase with HDIG domain